MRWVVIILFVFGAQFAFTAFAPADPGKAWLFWPFAKDSKSWLGFIGGLPSEQGSAVTPILAGIAGLCFIAAALALFGVVVPADGWRPLVIGGAIASILLNALYLGIWAIPPIVVDLVLLWGVLVQNWTVAGLSGS